MLGKASFFAVFNSTAKIIERTIVINLPASPQNTALRIESTNGAPEMLFFAMPDLTTQLATKLKI